MLLACLIAASVLPHLIARPHSSPRVRVFPPWCRGTFIQRVLALVAMLRFGPEAPSRAVSAVSSVVCAICTKDFVPAPSVCVPPRVALPPACCCTAPAIARQCFAAARVPLTAAACASCLTRVMRPPPRRLVVAVRAVCSTRRTHWRLLHVTPRATQLVLAFAACGWC